MYGAFISFVGNSRDHISEMGQLESVYIEGIDDADADSILHGDLTVDVSPRSLGWRCAQYSGDVGSRHIGECGNSRLSNSRNGTVLQFTTVQFANSGIHV